MSFVDLIPNNISFSGGWSNPDYAIGQDGNYATHVAGVTHYPLNFYDLTDGLPLDSVINGFQVIINAKTDLAASGKVAVTLFKANTFTPLITGSVSTVLTNSSGFYTIGSSADTWGYHFAHQDIRDNQYFGFSITPTGDNSVITMIDDVKLRLFYTSYSYLVGSRSVFTNSSDSGVDTDSNITSKFNSVSQSSQVLSEDNNKLGDALYNIEYAIVNQPNVVRSIGNPINGKTYVFSFTMSGTITNTISGEASYSIFKVGNTTGSNNINIASPLRVALPLLDKPMHCHFTSAIGWLSPAASANIRIPLYVKSNGLYFEKNNLGTQDYWISVGAIASGISAAVSGLTDADLSATVAGAYRNYIGSTFRPDLVSAYGGYKIYIKMLAIAKGV